MFGDDGRNPWYDTFIQRRDCKHKCKVVKNSIICEKCKLESPVSVMIAEYFSDLEKRMAKLEEALVNFLIE